MKPTNNLTSHHGERNSSRADKMSGWVKDVRGQGKSKVKKIYRRKNRKLLNNPYNFFKLGFSEDQIY